MVEALVVQHWTVRAASGVPTHVEALDNGMVNVAANATLTVEQARSLAAALLAAADSASV